MDTEYKKTVPGPVNPGQTGTDAGSGADLDEQSALHLTRAFWLAFNSINMYGDNHPQATRAVDSFHALLVHKLIEFQRILFHVERDGFFCGTWRMDRELKIMRLTERLTVSGVDAITFEQSVTNRGLGLFVTLLIDTKNFRTASEIEGALKAADVYGIRINRHKYVAQVITDIGTITPVKTESVFKGLEISAEEQKASAFDELDAQPDTVAENAEEDSEADIDIQFQAGSLDLGEITVDSPQAVRDKRSLQTWPDLTERLFSEIVKYKGGAEPTARFDRFYEILESLILRYLLDSKASGEEAVELDRQLARMEEVDWKLLSELDAPLRDHQLLEAVGGRLKDRFVNRVALLWADTLWQQYQPLDEDKLPAFFAKVQADMAKSPNPQVFLQTLLYLLDERGLTDTLFALVWERLVRHGGTAQASAETVVPVRLRMPQKIETRREILHDIETEMYRHNRYASPFSCLSISLLGVRNEAKGKICSFSDKELSDLYAFLAEELSASLRQLDRVGTLGPMRQNHLLILLPMTDVTGAVVLMERLERRSENWQVVSSGTTFYPVLIFSSFTYNAEKVKDIKSLLRKIRSKHRKKGQYMTQNVPELSVHQS